MPRFALAICSALLIVSPLFAQDRDVLRKMLVGEKPPELVSEKSHWMEGPPMTFATQKGKVVWLQFNF